MNQQKVLNFKFDNSYNEKDFILDSSNEKALLFFNKFPDWENKLINLVGSEKSGKTFLLKILNKKNDFYYLNTFPENNEEFDKLFNFERFLLDLNELDELKFFSILNHCIINDKFLVVSSLIPLTQLKLSLPDLKSRIKQFYILNIDIPSDQLIYSLILKFFSDNQVVIKKELIEFIVKKIDRSYPRINQFLVKLNDLSIERKKKIDFKLINEIIDAME
jgi:chromosomal replication initiation ATPase DnaA